MYRVALMVAFLPLACSEPQATPTEAMQLAAIQVPGRWIIALDRGADREAVIGSVPGNVRRRYRAVLNGFAGDFPGAAVEALRRNPNVRYVVPDRLVTVEQVGSWGLDRVDQRALPLDDSYTPQGDGTGVTMYSVDTGILYEHEQFEGRAGVGYDIDGGAGRDCHGHGTHTSGTMVGNTVGVAPAAHVIAVKVFPGCTGSTPTSEVIAGLDWVAQNVLHPAVINMSLGGPRTSPDPYDDATQALRDLGIHIVVSAGNSSADACDYTPASSPGALTVAATTDADALASFTNTGPCVDIAAPGVGIRSGNATGSYSWFNGTSMSAPHVSGALALLLSANADMSPAAAEADILARATALAPFGLLYVNGFGTTNPAPPRALPPAPPPLPQVPAYTLQPTTQQRGFVVSWAAPGADVTALRFRWRVADTTPECVANGFPCNHGGWREGGPFDPGVGSAVFDRLRHDYFDDFGWRTLHVQGYADGAGGASGWRPLDNIPTVEVCETRGGGARCR